MSEERKRKKNVCPSCGLEHSSKSKQMMTDIEADSYLVAIELAKQREEKGLRYVG